MKYYVDNVLRFDRNPDTISGIFEMFSVLENMEWETATIFSVEKHELVSINKDPIDIIKLDFAHSDFFGEFFLWFHGHPDKIKKPFWILDDIKAELFLKCLRASAKYYVLHKTKLYTLNRKNHLVNLFCDIFEEEIKTMSFYKN